MQQELAQRLLSATLNWSNEEIEKYRELLDDFSELKYDQYQQYKPSSRFVENLCIWLNQFKPEEREIALNFILNNLVFISPAEMQHLVNSVYPEIVLPVLEKQTEALTIAMKNNASHVDDVVELISRQSLFLAMSDGARIDVFRRASKLDHDQVCVNYDLSDTKFGEVISEMKKRTKELSDTNGLPSTLLTDSFRNVFLLDDFSGSGVSYLRKEDGVWKGKINKVLSHLINERIIQLDGTERNPEIHIILYLITTRAYTALKNNIDEYCRDKDIQIVIHYLQIIEPVTLTDEEENWLKEYYDPVIEDTHYRKGNMDYPHHGFDGCALALVIYHNTPNNSFPILWAGDNALFPRVTRHKDVRD